MKSQIRIEKRLPFGFLGDWGMLYKSYINNLKEEENNFIKVQENKYYDIGQDVQFKLANDITRRNEGIFPNVVMNNETTIIKTTDAYWDDARQEYECIVAIGDIVKVFRNFWEVDAIHTKIKRTPAPQKFFYISVKKVEEVLNA